MFSLILVFIATFLFIEWLTSKPKNYPPGPLCLPIVGSAPFVQSQNFHFYLEKVKKIYGPVIGFKFGSNPVIGVAGTKEVRDVLSKEEFQGRPQFPLTELGIMFSEGDFWSAQRRFTIRHLKEFGFGKKSAEFVILEEAEEFFENVLRKKDIVQVSGLFTVSAINVLWAMVAGRRFSHNEEEFKYLMKYLDDRFRKGNITGGLVTAMPFIPKIFKNYDNFTTQKNAKENIEKFLEKTIGQHKESKSDEPRDLLDVYLNELEKPGSHPSFSERTLRNVCIDLFGAGSESVSNNLGFCILYCVLYPKWQEQLLAEVDQNIANTPYLENQKKFPKVEAFLSEVSRCNTIATMAIPHKATRDTELGGYFIPKGATLLPSLWSVLQDKDVWKDPENFRPERFLDENGNYKKEAGWMPVFGMGKRLCPGEALAKNIVFVFFIALLREFKFSLPEGHPKPSTVCLPGFTNAPQPFFAKVTKR